MKYISIARKRRERTKSKNALYKNAFKKSITQIKNTN